MKATKILTITFCLYFIAGCGAKPQPTDGVDHNPNLEYEITQETTQTKLKGKPFEVPVDNCNNPAESIKSETRSEKYRNELSITISEKVAIEFSGDIQVAKAAIQTEIGLQLGITMGKEVEASSSLATPILPGHKGIITAQWSESWIEGTAQVKRADGTVVDRIPFSVLNDLTLEQLGITQVLCQEAAQISVERPMPTPTPEITQARSTPEPERVGVLTIPGNSTAGISFPISQTGKYRIRYLEGAFSKYALDKTPAGENTWLTAVRIFKNKPIEWDGKMVSEGADYRIASEVTYSSKAEAEAAASGQEISLWLTEGETLTLVAVDHKDYYYDNPGEVVLEVIFLAEK